ncbi:MAG: hypothetical protein WC683_10440 [bacterium]|jgi:hypothetical protein
MTRLVVTLKPTPLATRLLVTNHEEEVLRAVLPPPSQAHPRAAATLLEALSLWFQEPLSAVLCADATGASSALGLCDGFGFGAKTVHYEVAVVEPRRRRRRLGTFADLRRLAQRGAV